MRLFILTLLMCGGLYAQNSNTDLKYYFSELEFNSPNLSIPTPKEIIGHQVGEWHITHDKLEKFHILLKNTGHMTKLLK